MNAPQVLELPLDDALLKVLSSESRREILRLLAERRMTGAEMAVRLNLGKPAVSEHLKKLTEAGLIDRMDDPERRWVYYNLSTRGKSILEPQRVRFYLVMAVASLALVLGMALALGIMVIMQGSGAAGSVALADQGSQDGSSVADSAAEFGPFRAATAADAPTTAARPVTPDPVVPPTTKTPAVTVVTGVPHKVCALGKDCSSDPPATPDTTAAFVLILADGAIAPPLNGYSLYVYHEADVDAVTHTIKVQAVQADAAGTIAVDLGAGKNTSFANVATALGAIPLATGGALVPVAADIQIPAAAPPVILDGVANATADEPTSTPVSTQQPAQSTPSTTQSAQPTAEAPMTTGNDGTAMPPPMSTTPTPAVVPPTDDAPTAAPGQTPLNAARTDPASAGPVAGAPAVAGADNALANASRQPSDSALVPFLALLAAAIVIGLVRRRA